MAILNAAAEVAGIHICSFLKTVAVGAMSPGPRIWCQGSRSCLLWSCMLWNMLVVVASGYWSRETQHRALLGKLCLPSSHQLVVANVFMCVHAWGKLKWSISPVSTCLPLVLQFQSLICIYYQKIEWSILLVGVLRFMSQVFVWISFPRVIFPCTFATLFCVCTHLRAWCAVKHLKEIYWDFSFHFEKSSWNSFTLRFIGAQPFILQSAVFRLTRRKTDTNATPVQTTVLRFILLFFL